MRKRLKLIIVAIAIGLGSLCILVMAGVVLILFLDLPFFIGDMYIERAPERMLNHLEKTFVIDFPEDITEVKAAKTPGSWDGAIGFMVKFAADPNTVNRFFKSFQQEVNLHPYTREDDSRDILKPAPKWFLEPIKQGKEAGPSLVSRDYGKASSHLSVYVDTTNQENFVVYIHGGYDSELDY